MDLNTLTVPPELNTTTDLDIEKRLVRRVERALKGAPIAPAMNALGRTMHGLQQAVARAQAAERAAAPAAQPGPALVPQG